MTERPFQARARVGRTWMVIESEHRLVEWYFTPGVLGDHARWAFKLAHREWLRSWRWWRPIPPAPFEVRFEDEGPLEKPVAWLLAAWALWRALR